MPAFTPNYNAVAIPTAIGFYENQPMFQWLEVENNRFLEPFFEDTLLRARCRHASLRRPRLPCLSTLDFVLERTAITQTPEIILFHTSRCGSTLLTQLFSELFDFQCLSEVPLLDQVLALRNAYPESVILSLYRASVNLLTHRCSRWVIKTDSWHLFHHAFVRACYPNTQYVLLYRDPRAVWKSHLKSPGRQSVPGMLTSGQLHDECSLTDTTLSREEYFARLMNAYLRCALRIKQESASTLLINYSEGVENMMKKLTGSIARALSETEWQAIQSRAAYHAKHPHQPFTREKLDESCPDFLQESLSLYHQLDDLNHLAGL